MVRDGEEEEEMMMMIATKPAWLEGLMAETFFSSCGIHETRRKSEKNVFCLLCCLSVCPHCLPAHRSHPLLQVRRYVYHDVVRLSDLEKLIDCSYVQPYTINGAKVIFINQRPQSRAKVSSNVCFTCVRILQEPFHFCSLSCKVDYLSYQGDDLSSILYRIDESDFTFEGLRMDGHDQLGEISTMEDAEDIMVISDESEQGNNSHKKEKKKKNKKKKQESNYLPGMVLSSLGNRRKGAPHRAPFS
ncbi:unnamed protein product [Arabidopsis arenosa]|uniref:PLATZ transcription factor family protein n=1 Tax=Arabidopsis arenosa TaxID=38785 RepID=A0A8S1ZI95_ARAAE|nr:unnamed protein product [Arabidopsis arenosa]